MEIVREKERIEELRKQQSERELEKASAVAGGEEGGYDDGTREKDEKAGVLKAKKPADKTSTPSLRIMEDTAKYLLNLNEDSAYFNPKCRAMRENPNPNDPDSQFKGENELRMTGAAIDFINQEKFAWDAVERSGLDLSSISNPTLTERVFR